MEPSLCNESVNGHFWSNLCLNCIFKWTWFVKTDIWSVIDRSRVRFPVAAALIFFFFHPFLSLFWLASPSVPLEFPKLANAQPSNFGPLRIFCTFIRYLRRLVRGVMKRLEKRFVARPPDPPIARFITSRMDTKRVPDVVTTFFVHSSLVFLRSSFMYSKAEWLADD